MIEEYLLHLSLYFDLYRVDLEIFVKSKLTNHYTKVQVFMIVTRVIRFQHLTR